MSPSLEVLSPLPSAVRRRSHALRPTRSLYAAVYHERCLLLVRQGSTWQLPGGLLQEAETDEVGLRRLMHEQLHLTIDVDRAVGVPAVEAQHASQLYLCKLAGAAELSADALWVRPTDLPGLALITDPVQARLLSDALSLLSTPSAVVAPEQRLSAYGLAEDAWEASGTIEVSASALWTVAEDGYLLVWERLPHDA